MNIQIVELGFIGRETKGNPDLASPILEVQVKGFRRSEDDDDGQ
jgi:hypothetical protein